MLEQIHKTRRANMRLLVQEHGTKAFMRVMGWRAPSVISVYAGRNAIRDVSERLARRIEQAFDLPFGWMDIARGGE